MTILKMAQLLLVDPTNRAKYMVIPLNPSPETIASYGPLTPCIVYSHFIGMKCLNDIYGKPPWEYVKILPKYRNLVLDHLKPYNDQDFTGNDAYEEMVALFGVEKKEFTKEVIDLGVVTGIIAYKNNTLVPTISKLANLDTKMLLDDQISHLKQIDNTVAERYDKIIKTYTDRTGESPKAGYILRLLSTISFVTVDVYHTLRVINFSKKLGLPAKQLAQEYYYPVSTELIETVENHPALSKQTSRI